LVDLKTEVPPTVLGSAAPADEASASAGSEQERTDVDMEKQERTDVDMENNSVTGDGTASEEYVDLLLRDMSALLTLMFDVLVRNPKGHNHKMLRKQQKTLWPRRQQPSCRTFLPGFLR
jgi:hypothetical protein